MFKSLKRSCLLLLALLFVAWLITFLLLHSERHEYYQASKEQRDQASEYLKGKLSPVPDEWTWETFTPETGIELRTGAIDHAQAKGTIVFVPGFTGTIEMAMNTITQLNQAGFRVAAIEYRGQGRSYRPLSNPEKGYVQSHALLASDLVKFADHIKRPNEPLFFFSYSKGAHITLRMAAEYNAGVTAYALVVPMVKINTGALPYTFVKYFARSLSVLGLGSMYAPGQQQWPDKPIAFGVANNCNSNPATAQVQSAMFTLDASIRTEGATIQWLKEATNSSDKLQSKGFMDKLTQPVKMFTAGVDNKVDTQAATDLCNSIAQCSLTHFEQAGHCIDLENQERMNEIIRQSITHFEQNLSTP